MNEQPPVVLTIGGSDSGGAAGIQADLKTFTAWRVYGMSALAAVTAQNSVRVAAVHYLPDNFVVAQIDAVLGDYGAAAMKTGFLGRASLVSAVVACLHGWRERAGERLGPLVVDPVLVNRRGEAMSGPDVTSAYYQLLPLAALATPNRAEAALLAGAPVESLAGAAEAARQIHALGAGAVLVKGIRAGSEIIDLFFDGSETHALAAPYLATANTHGSGDTLGAAIAAGLAWGLPLAAAIERARAYTAAALRGASGWRLGAGHGPLQHWIGDDERP